MTLAGPRPSLWFERSEISLAHVNRTSARFAAETAARRRRRIGLPSRLLATSLPSAYEESWNVSRVEDALVRLIAIAEEFSYGLLLEVTDLKLPTDDRVTTLWETHVDRETETWEQRIATWRRMHALSIPASPRYDVLFGFIQARNAIVHGLGSLTRKQLRDRAKSVARLKAARITVAGDRLELNDRHVDGCADTVRAFIRWLDDAATRVP
jgi:hypothetical protein